MINWHLQTNTQTDMYKKTVQTDYTEKKPKAHGFAYN